MKQFGGRVPVATKLFVARNRFYVPLGSAEDVEAIIDNDRAAMNSAAGNRDLRAPFQFGGPAIPDSQAPMLAHRRASVRPGAADDMKAAVPELGHTEVAGLGQIRQALPRAA